MESLEDKQYGAPFDETLVSRNEEDETSDIDSFEQITTAIVSDSSYTNLTTAVQRQHFDLDSVRRITLTVSGFDVGAAFWQLQKEAAPFINDESKKVCQLNLGHFRTSAGNVVGDSRQDTIGDQPLTRMTKELRSLFVDLASDLASTGRVRMRDHAVETDEEEEEVLKLFLLLSESPPYMNTNEDTYYHDVLDPIFSFLVRNWDIEYNLSWANRPSPGSRERCGSKETKKPDGTIVKEQFDMGFVEIKAPKDDRCVRFYILDKWKLTSLAKDTIDLHLREQRHTITSVFLPASLWVSTLGV